MMRDEFDCDAGETGLGCVESVAAPFVMIGEWERNNLA
jgi:hypothetical protein